MLVEEMMTKNVYTLKKDDTIEKAIQLIKEKRIRHIPIVDDEMKCIGIVTDRDIRLAVPSIFSTNEQKEVFQKPIGTIMTRDVITAHPLDFVEEVAAIFYQHHIGCLPIVKENRLVGIITQTDLLKTFIELVGANQPGSHMEVRVLNKTGILHDIVHIIREHHINIHSVLVYPDKKDHKYKILVFRLGTINPYPVVEHLQNNGFEVLWPLFSGMKS